MMAIKERFQALYKKTFPRSENNLENQNIEEVNIKSLIISLLSLLFWTFYTLQVVCHLHS
jgi:uncharacterized protein with PQ loop repeat